MLWSTGRLAALAVDMGGVEGAWGLCVEEAGKQAGRPKVHGMAAPTAGTGGAWAPARERSWTDDQVFWSPVHNL